MNLTMMSQVVIQKQTLGLPKLLESSLLKELAFTARVNRASTRQTQGKWNCTPNYGGCQVSNGYRDREMFEQYSRDFE